MASKKNRNEGKVADDENDAGSGYGYGPLLYEIVHENPCCTTYAIGARVWAIDDDPPNVACGLVKKKNPTKNKISSWSILFDNEKYAVDEKYWTLFGTEAEARKALLALQRKMNET